MSGDEWLAAKADGALELKSELEYLQHHFLETDDVPAYFNAVAVTCGLTDKLIRVAYRLNTFSSKVEEVEKDLFESLNSMCVKRAKTESDAIGEEVLVEERRDSAPCEVERSEAFSTAILCRDPVHSLFRLRAKRRPRPRTSH